MNNAWQAGDFSRIAPSAVIVGELICDQIPIYAGQTVLDIGCGSGNTALAAARRRAVVSAIDPVPMLLEQARLRAEVERLEIEWKQGGAEALPFADQSFDIALSSFGMIFSTQTEESAAEAARVLNASGTLVLTSWESEGQTDRLFAICEEAIGNDRMLQTARSWGRQEDARVWLAPHFSTIHVVRRDFLVRAMDAQRWLAGMKMFLAPVVLAYEKLTVDEAEQMDARMLGLVKDLAPAPNGTLFTRVPYLEYYCSK